MPRPRGDFETVDLKSKNCSAGKSCWLLLVGIARFAGIFLPYRWNDILPASYNGRQEI